MPTDEPDYLVSIDGLGNSGPEDADCPQDRQWLGVRFDCCGIYQRIYKTQDGSAYRGRCPRCLREVHVKVGPGGTDARFFVAE